MNSLIKSCVTFFALFILTLPGCKKNNEPDPSAILAIESVTPSSAAQGVTVVIEGSAFSPVLTENIVKFGGIAAIVDSASATRLVTKVPNGAVTGNMSVSVGSKIFTSTADFTVTTSSPLFDNNASDNETSGITRTTATVTGTLTRNSGQAISQYGHVWSKSVSSPTLADNKTELGALSSTAPFPHRITSSLKNLEGNTTYQVRAYVTVGGVTTYGSVFQVKTKSNPSSWGNVKVLAEFPGIERSDSKLFTINNKLYVFGGRTQKDYTISCTNDLWEYNVNDNKWAAKKTIPVSCSYNFNKNTPLMLFGNEAYFLVQNTSTHPFETTVYSYSTVTDSWKVKKKVPFDGSGRAVFVLGTKGYVVGGSTSGPANKDVWEYDFALDTWTKKNNFPGESREAAYGTSFNGKGYIMGGQNASNTDLQDVWAYNASNDQWIQKKSAALSSSSFFKESAFMKGNTIFFLGFPNTYYMYNLVTDTWSEQKQPSDLTGNQYDPRCENYFRYYNVINIGSKLYLHFVDFPGKYASLNNQLWEYKF